MPKVIHGLQDQMITDGQPCIFKCSVSAPDGASVIWYHDGKLLESSNEIKQSFVNGKATLDISEVFPDDEGEYKCVITCATGQAETTARLTVLGRYFCSEICQDVFKAYKKQALIIVLFVVNG